MGEMNVICNNCVGARVYQQLGLQFANPFMWADIPNEEYIYLINHFDEINFENISLIKKDFFYLTIDGKVTLRYIHHFQNDSYEKPTVVGGTDLYYKDMGNYIVDCYKKRLKRMTDPPIFIISETPAKSDKSRYEFGDIKLFEKIKSNYPVLYVGKNDPRTNKVKFIQVKHYNTTLQAQEIIETMKWKKS